MWSGQGYPGSDGISHGGRWRNNIRIEVVSRNQGIEPLGKREMNDARIPVAHYAQIKRAPA